MTASDLAKCPNCQGCRITVVLHTECRVPWRDIGLCPDCNGSGYVKRPEETDEQFKARVAEKLSAKVESCNVDAAHSLTREPRE